MPDIIEILTRLLAAAIFGGVLGLEREYYGKSAGVRTYALVGIGSALFTLLSQFGFSGSGSDPTRIASQIVVGIGFLGAGLIIHRDVAHVEGLTTAAGLWVVASIGMAFGVGWYAVGILAACITLIVLNVFGRVRYRMEHHEVASKSSKSSKSN
ncbi:MgtC/SapB family protein [Candidatus Uhrbacteria bacterium]|nr:MgtC/SapB family protein [Candidatus Uhrbacteria bacterium]